MILKSENTVTQWNLIYKGKMKVGLRGSNNNWLSRNGAHSSFVRWRAKFLSDKVGEIYAGLKEKLDNTDYVCFCSYKYVNC